VKEHPTSERILRLLFWETTIKCNLTCAHCRRIEDDQAVVTDLSTEQGMDLIDQLAEVAKKQPMMPVLVFSGGEPLCREDLFDLVAHARKAGLTLALASNGTMIDSSVAEKIKASGIARVSISLDGATAEVHNKLRQLEGSFEGAIEGIGHLREKDVPFQVNITLTKHNAHQLQEVYDLVKSLGAVALHIFMLVPVGCGQTLAETDMLSPEQYEKMLIEICKLDGLGELQVKVTCGPHYERIIREQGLHRARKASGHPRRSARPTNPRSGALERMPRGLGRAIRRPSGRCLPMRVSACQLRQYTRNQTRRYLAKQRRPGENARHEQPRGQVRPMRLQAALRRLPSKGIRSNHQLHGRRAVLRIHTTQGGDRKLTSGLLKKRTIRCAPFDLLPCLFLS